MSRGRTLDSICSRSMLHIEAFEGATPFTTAYEFPSRLICISKRRFIFYSYEMYQWSNMAKTPSR
jgi:hypothetical protein